MATPLAVEVPSALPIERLEVPPLRERKEDLPALIKECLRRNGVIDLEETISGAAIRKLMLYPLLGGNVAGTV